jgi:hypothetical protein
LGKPCAVKDAIAVLANTSGVAFSIIRLVCSLRLPALSAETGKNLPPV